MQTDQWDGCFFSNWCSFSPVNSEISRPPTGKREIQVDGQVPDQRRYKDSSRTRLSLNPIEHSDTLRVESKVQRVVARGTRTRRVGSHVSTGEVRAWASRTEFFLPRHFPSSFKSHSFSLPSTPRHRDYHFSLIMASIVLGKRNRGSTTDKSGKVEKRLRFIFIFIFF